MTLRRKFLKWEVVAEDDDGSSLERTDVPGGWLYRTCLCFTQQEHVWPIAFVPYPPADARMERVEEMVDGALHGARLLPDIAETGLSAPLPAGYQYGADAMEQVELGKRLATEAIVTVLRERALSS